MKKIVQQIKKHLGFKSQLKYGGMTIDEWHYHYRRDRKLDEKQLLLGIKEALGYESEISIEDVPQLYFKTQSLPVLCLCACIFTLEETVSDNIIKKLIESLKHREETVRRFSAIALTEINKVSTLSAVVAGNSHGHAIRTEAAWRLKKFGPQAREAISSLISLIEYPKINWRSHYAASEALSNIGEDAKDELLKRLDSSSKSVRYYCALALEQMNNTKLHQKKIENILKNDVK